MACPTCFYLIGFLLITYNAMLVRITAYKNKLFAKNRYLQIKISSSFLIIPIVSLFE